MLLAFTFDAVFSHLQLTDGCTVKKVNKMFCLPTVASFLETLVETNNVFSQINVRPNDSECQQTMDCISQPFIHAVLAY